MTDNSSDNNSNFDEEIKRLIFDATVDYEFESQKILHSIVDDLKKIEQEFQQSEVQLKALDAEEQAIRQQLSEILKRKAQFADRSRELRFDFRRKQQERDRQELQVELDKANKTQQEELAKRSQHFDLVTANSKWRGQEYKHQLEGAHFLASASRALCADDMGLGKTLQILMTLEMIEAKRILIICPANLATMFQQEILRWTTYTPFNIASITKPMQEMMLNVVLPSTERSITIVNYDTWNRDKNILTWLKNAGYDSIVLDEAHRIKETDKLPYKGTAEIVFAQNACPECYTPIGVEDTVRHCPEHGVITNEQAVPSIKNVYCMTGTPILNRPEEIYPLLHLTHPEVFPTRRSFNDAFTDFSGMGWGYNGQAELAKRISGFYIRRTKEDAGIVLPPQAQVVHEITIEDSNYPLQRELLDMLFRDAQMKIHEADGAESTTGYMNTLALITRQRQATVWPGGIKIKRLMYDETGNPVWDWDKNEQAWEEVHIGQHYRESAKLDYAEQLYHDLVADGHRVVFFSQFKEALKEMKNRLGDEVVEFHGDTPNALREQIKRNFNASVDEEVRWNGVLCHYETGGVGLTLTNSTAMIILDEAWNAGTAQQAYDRIHRIGQTRETQVHILRHIGMPSIDEWLANLIDLKRDMVDGFNISIDEMKGAFK